MDQDTLKQIRIKGSSLSRLISIYIYTLSGIYECRIYKELLSYQEEGKKEEEKLKALEDANEDEHKIKQYQMVLDETIQMIPNCKNFLMFSGG